MVVLYEYLTKIKINIYIDIDFLYTPLKSMDLFFKTVIASSGCSTVKEGTPFYKY